MAAGGYSRHFLLRRFHDVGTLPDDAGAVCPDLRSLGVRDNTRGYRRTSSARYRRTVPLNVLLTRTAALRRLSVRNSNEYLPALPIGEGALPALEWLGKYVREAAVELSEILSLSF